MIFDLSRFFNETHKVYHFDGKEKSDSLNHKIDSFKIVGPIDYKGEIFKVDGSNLIHIDVSYKYETQCDRCLQPITLEIKTSLSGKLVEGSKKAYDDEDEDEGDEEFVYFENDLLDPSEYIINQVVSSLPMKSICSEDCQGLCFNCGVDLNKESCECIIENIDPRFEKLKNFFPKK